MLTVVLALLAAGCMDEPLEEPDGAVSGAQGTDTDADEGPGADASPAAPTGSPGNEGERAGETGRPATEEPLETVARRRTDRSQFQAGVALLIYGNEEPQQFRDKTRRALDSLVDVGANSVSIVFPVFQADWRATEVVADPGRTPSEDRLRLLARSARQRGFTVMLRPILDEASLQETGHWRGSISPADAGAWFDSYGDLLTRYAALASEEGVDMIAIGSELTSLQDETDRWLALTDRIREVYQGGLLYAANWDAPAPAISGELDWHGVDAFYPLDAGAAAGHEELAAAWDPWLAELDAAGVDLDRVVFTEIGVRAQQGAHLRPHVWEHGTPADPEAQARYYETACERLAPALAGLYWWRVDFDYPDGADSVESFSPLGKPAETALRRCYEAQ